MVRGIFFVILPIIIIASSILMAFSQGSKNSPLSSSEEIKNYADRQFLIDGLKAQESQNAEAKKYTDEAWNYYYQSDYTSAIASFEKAHQIDPKTPDPSSPDFYWVLGVIQGKRGNPDGAITIYQKGLVLTPNNSRLICAEGFGYEDKFFQNTKNNVGDLTTAINFYEKGVQVDPNSIYCRGYLAEAYYYAGNYSEAWKHVNIGRKQGSEPPAGFIRDLTQKMPNPEK